MSGCSCSAAGFRSAIDGTTKSFTRANITADGEYRSIQVANAMRAQHIIVYSIGEGTDVNLTFLQEVANDPSLAGTPGYAATPYDGEAMIANDPTELEQVFEQIAAKILLRLTQ